MRKDPLGIFLDVLGIALLLGLVYLALFGADQALGWNLIDMEDVKLMLSIAQPVFWVVIGGLIERARPGKKQPHKDEPA